jgi:hypothetical protein
VARVVLRAQAEKQEPQNNLQPFRQLADLLLSLCQDKESKIGFGRAKNEQINKTCNPDYPC